MPKLESYLGIDLGAGGVKMVELAAEKEGPRLVTYGYSRNSLDQLRSVTAEDPRELGQIIKSVGQRARVTTTRCITALPTFAVFTSIITLSEVSKKDLPEAIRLQAKKVIPLPLEQMILDWKVLTEEEKSGKPGPGERQESATIRPRGGRITRVLLTAAAKDLVQKYVEAFKAAGFQLLSLETEAFALTRALLGGEKTVSMVIDLGATNTNMSVIDQGIPILNRGVDLGGITLSQIIADNLKISLEKAEQFKKDWHTLAPGQEIPDQIRQGLMPLINEVKYIFNFYQTQSKYIGLTVGDRVRIEKIVLTGGSAFIPGLADYLSRLLNVQVFLGDPWARVDYPSELRPVLGEIGPIMSVAVGLALRNLE